MVIKKNNKSDNIFDELFKTKSINTRYGTVYKGSFIKIIKMADKDIKDLQATMLNGTEGSVEYIDDQGQLHGSWGSLAVIPEKDIFEIICE